MSAAKEGPMRKSNRMFEIIQLLRAANHPMRADDLATQLEVSPRTIYRDIAALQAMQTPIDGAAGIGYVMRQGYDLPPLNFDTEEIEALRVGLAMLSRTGDSALQDATNRIRAKVDALHGPADWLQVSPWGAPLDDPAKGCIPGTALRHAIRSARKLQFIYKDEQGSTTNRVIRPVAIFYHVECKMIAGWCELRAAFRHFRTDRIYDYAVLEDSFADQAETLRALWSEHNNWDHTKTESV